MAIVGAGEQDIRSFGVLDVLQKYLKRRIVGVGGIPGRFSPLLVDDVAFFRLDHILVSPASEAEKSMLLS